MAKLMCLLGVPKWVLREVNPEEWTDTCAVCGKDWQHHRGL